MTWGTTRFAPGRAIGLVGRETLALVMSDDAGVRATLWTMVAGDAAVDEILEALSGHGLRNLPSFAIVRLEGDDIVRVVVRGVASVRLATTDGEVVVESRSAKTWIEREVEGVSEIGLHGDDAAEEHAFHVLAGAVPAGSLRRLLTVDDPHAAFADDGWSTSVSTEATVSTAGDMTDAAARRTAPDVEAADDGAVVAEVSESVVEAADVVPAVPSPSAGAAPADDVDDVVAPDAPAAGDVLGATDGPADDAVPGEAPGASAFDDVLPGDVTATPPDDVLVDDASPAAPMADPSSSSPAVVTPSPYDSGATLLPGDLERLPWPPDVAHANEPSPGGASTPAAAAGDAGGTGDDDAYDYLFGRTVARSVQQAAVQSAGDDHDHGQSPDLIAGVPSSDPVPPAPPPMPAPGGVAAGVGGAPMGDHDGRTISRAELARMRAESAMVPVGPVVQARLCINAHPNPTHLTICRTCGGQVTADPPVSVPRPVLGVLRFSNGLVVQLDRPQLIGRSPKVEGQVGGELPNLVKLEEAGQGVSRRHVAVHLENWQVLLEDLNSANGTIVALPGRPARRMVAGEPIALEHGTVVDLGGEMSMSFEVSR